MPLDRARADEQLRADLGVGATLSGQARDLGLLRGELGKRRGAAPADLLTGGEQLAPGALGERVHADRAEHVVGDAELLARVHPAVLAAEPLAVQKMGPRQLVAQAGSAQTRDALAIERLGLRALGEQRLRARPDPQRPIRAARGPPLPPAPR